MSGQGRFCTDCPIVVLDADHFHEMAQLGLPGGREFAVAGFADLDAVPEDKKRVPLGQDDNPIPFAEFKSFEWRDGGSRPASRRLRLRAANHPSRVRLGTARRKGPALNARCPCGSGRKYKRCCMVGQEARA